MIKQVGAGLLFSVLAVVACGQPRVPDAHRPEVAKCSTDPRPASKPGPIPADRAQGDHPDCVSDAECTAGKNGRCTGGGHDLQRCSYDTCMSDADCPHDRACLCDPNEGNACIPANCRTDAECNGRGCSPTRSETCGNMEGTVGFYCHNAHDECTTDAECTGGDHGGLCVYGAAAGHWVCSYSSCVG